MITQFTIDLYIMDKDRKTHPELRFILPFSDIESKVATSKI